MAASGLKNLHRLIKQATNDVPSPASFVADLTACVEACVRKEQRNPSTYYKPSSLNCIRNMYFQRIGQNVDPSKTGAGLVRIGESGTDSHIRIQSWICKMKQFNIDCEYIDIEEFISQRNLPLIVRDKREYEVKLFNPDLNMSFLTDGILRYKKKYFIFEYKTESMYKWQSRTAVAQEHENQAISYSLNFNIDDVMFLYEARDTCSWKSYIYNVTDVMREERVIKPIKLCEEYVSKKEVPPKPIVSKKDCQYCPYIKSCLLAGE